MNRRSNEPEPLSDAEIVEMGEHETDMLSFAEAGMPAKGDAAVMPVGINYAYLFQIFNSASYWLVIGVPMFLFFKHLNASAIVLGLVPALPPLLTLLQIPAAKWVEKLGYGALCALRVDLPQHPASGHGGESVGYRCSQPGRQHGPDADSAGSL